MIANVIGPRLTGSPAHKQAADWVRSRLAEWGMSSARLEPFAFGRGWTLEKLTLEMTAPRYFPLTGYPEAWMPSTKGLISGTPIYLGEKTQAEIEAMGDQLKGAIILSQRPQTSFITQDRVQPSTADGTVRIGAPATLSSASATPTRTMTPILQRFGAAAILRPNQGQHGTIFVLGSQNTRNDAVPSIVLEAEHYNMVVRLVQSGAPVKLNVEMRASYQERDSNTYNVIAEIPGEDPVLRNEIVLIGAHLDSWHSATGATDNADAVSEALEAMRILKAVGAHPRRTIRVAIWSGEEEGLLGSKAYVTQHLAGDANAAAREQLAVYFNDDPGMGPTYGWYMENNPAAKAIFDAWLEPLKDLGMKRNVLPGIGNTDHLSFTALGLPAFTTIKDYTDYDVRTHHTNADFFERVSEADLKQSSIVLASFAWHAAMRNEKIPRVVR
jgi:hypothetical protein